MALSACLLLGAATQAQAETRTLKLYFIHTKERAEITFKKNGRYVPSGLQQINRFLRDWRRNEPTKMDPALLDVVWEAYRTVGGRDYIHVVSAYRSPATNSMLRSRSRGVAQKSQHMLGKAMDFYIPGVKLATLRAAGLRIGAGGVGYYPTSGSPFVHFDVGNVRHWPKMSRKELVAVFPNGKTLHVPSDGKPLPGFEQAVAAYQARKKGGGSSVMLASTSEEGETASKRGGGGGGFLAALFSGGGGADEEEDNSPIQQIMTARDETPRASKTRPAQAAPAQAAPAPAAKAETLVARAEPPADVARLPGVAEAAPAPAARPAAPVVAPVVEAPVEAPAPVAEQSPEQIIAALPTRSVPLPIFAPRPQAEVGPVVAAVAPVPAEAAPPATVAEAVADPAVPVEVALNIPLPTWRPAHETPVAAETVAAVEATGDAAQIRSSALAAAPAQTVEAKPAGALPQAVADAKAKVASDEYILAAFAPVPAHRPKDGPLAEMVAALPQPRPARVATGDGDVVGATERVGKGGRVADKAGSPRAAIVASAGKVAPDDAISSKVKTTAKASKPGPKDTKSDRKPVVMPVEEVESRWALETAGRLTRSIASSKEQSLAYNAIRTAPKQVYTSGFAPVAAEPDPARFSGNAVTFLSVAKFEAE